MVVVVLVLVLVLVVGGVLVLSLLLLLLAHMLPRRVHRFRGCNLPELEFWHVAVWTKNLRFVFRIGFYSAVLEKQKTRGLAHSRVFPVGICVPCLLRCFFLACN